MKANYDHCEEEVIVHSADRKWTHAEIVDNQRHKSEVIHCKN